MITPSLFTESVQLLRRTVTGTDDYGQDVTTWDGPKSPAWLEQINSSETVAQNEQTTARMMLYLPLDADLSWYERVRWGGFDWRVDGEPGRQPGGFVVEGYQVVAISRVKG